MAKKESIHVSTPKETRKWIEPGDIDLICQAWEKFNGDLVVFESAVGALLLGRLAGNDVLRVVHSSRTLRKYEGVLGIKFKDILEARTADSRRVNGIRYADGFTQFWKALGAGIAQQPDAKSVVTE